MNIDTGKFDGCYFSGDVLPIEFTSRLDKDIIDLFHEGKEALLGDIKFEFPEIFEYLDKDMSDLFLVRSDLGSKPLFYWALQSEDFNIFSSVPRVYRKLKQKISEREYYSSLPEYLKPFYHTFNGFEMTAESHIHSHQGGFLLSFSNWYGIDLMGEYLGASSDAVILKNKFSGGDVRVIGRALDDEVLLFDMKGADKKIYCAPWEKLSLLEEVADPKIYISKMFFNSVNRLTRV